MQEQRRHGFADDVRTADDHRVQAAQVAAGFVQQAHAAAGRAGREYLDALHQAADVFAVEAIHVLDRVNRVDHRRLVDVRRQWQLHEDAVDRRIGIQLRKQVQHLRLAGILRQPVFQGANPDFLGPQQFIAHVDVAGRVIAHQQYRQGRVDLLRG